MLSPAAQTFHEDMERLIEKGYRQARPLLETDPHGYVAICNTLDQMRETMVNRYEEVTNA